MINFKIIQNMKNLLPRTIVVFILILCATNLFAQEVISAAGDNSIVGDKQISWTIGEPVVETEMNGLYILTQGLHQGNLVVTVAREIAGLDFQVTAYPNPVSKYLKLDIDAPQLANFSYALFNAEGQLLQQAEVTQKVSTILMDEYTHSSYLLRVLSEGEEVKVFRIIKNK
jgi:hypothetical protein